jgi:hypothetical protein
MMLLFRRRNSGNNLGSQWSSMNETSDYGKRYSGHKIIDSTGNMPADL